MENGARLDRVTIFNNKLSFLIPHEWAERTEDETEYMYSFPGAESGWLRVSLITGKATSEAPSQRLNKLFQGEQTRFVEPETGNLVCAYEKDSVEAGVPIHLYCWKVANIVQPNLVREAVFSYTVLSERDSDEETKKVVGLLAELVSRVVFLQPIESNS